MYHEGNEVCQGYLTDFDLDHNLAIVEIWTDFDVHVGLLQHAVEFLPHCKVIAIGREITGKLMARRVQLMDDLSVSEDSEDLDCKIKEVHPHDDSCILFCFCYYMHRGTENDSFLCNS